MFAIVTCHDSCQVVNVLLNIYGFCICGLLSSDAIMFSVQKKSINVYIRLLTMNANVLVIQLLQVCVVFVVVWWIPWTEKVV